MTMCNPTDWLLEFDDRAVGSVAQIERQLAAPIVAIQSKEKQVFRIASTLALLLTSIGLACGQQPLPADAKIERNSKGKVVSIHLDGRSSDENRPDGQAAIDAIATYSDLETLSLFGMNVNDENVAQLSDLKKLKVIDLSYTNVTGASLGHLSKISGLLSIRLTGCDVRDDHLVALRKMPSLAMLYLERTKVTDIGLRHIRGLDNLILLDLQSCNVSDNGLASLGDFPQIQHLWLSKTIRYGKADTSNLTDKCVNYPRFA